jgi:hypothetical protein
MSAASNYTEEATLKHIFQNASTNGTAWNTATTDIYVSLHTGSPGEANDGANEISDGNYARQQVTFGDVTVVSDTASLSSNVTVQFPQATVAYSANVTHLGLYDASSAGNLLFYGSLSTEKQVTVGDVFQINSGSLTVTLD